MKVLLFCCRDGEKGLRYLEGGWEMRAEIRGRYPSVRDLPKRFQIFIDSSFYSDVGFNDVGTVRT
jgi:hypothetical protein